jgi:hypothetical protein
MLGTVVEPVAGLGVDERSLHRAQSTAASAPTCRRASRRAARG